VQLPALPPISNDNNNNILNIDGINNYYFSKLNRKNKVFSPKNFNESLKSNFIFGTEVLTNQNNNLVLNLPSTVTNNAGNLIALNALNALNTLNITDLNSNYIANLTYNEYNNYELDKIRNLQLIENILNKSNQMSPLNLNKTTNNINYIKNNKTLFMNKNENNNSNNINNLNLNGTNNNYCYKKKKSYNYDLSNSSNILYDDHIRSLQNNVNSNPNNYYERRQMPEPLNNEEIYNSRFSYRNANFSGGISPVVNKKRKSSFNSRKKITKIKTPKKLLNKKFDEDQVQIINGNSAIPNMKNFISTTNFNRNIVEFSNEKQLGFKDVIKKNNSDFESNKSIKADNISFRKSISQVMNLSNTGGYKRELTRDFILDPLNLIGDIHNNSHTTNNNNIYENQDIPRSPNEI